MVPDRSPEIAVPLKAAIASTEGLVLVRTIPTHTKTYLKMGIDGREGPVAFAPSEKLFLAVTPYPNNMDGVSDKLVEVARGLDQDSVRFLSRSRSYSHLPQTSTLPELSYQETLPNPIRVDSTSLYTTDDPELRGLLKEVMDIDTDEVRERTRMYTVTRTSQAVVYPSVQAAELAVEIKALKDDPDFFSGFGAFKGDSGVLTVMRDEDIRKFASGEVDPEALREIGDYYVRGFKTPTSNQLSA